MQKIELHTGNIIKFEMTSSHCVFLINQVLFLLSDKLLVNLVFYSILLHVSAVHISHHWIGQWFSLQMAGVKLL